MCGTGHGLMRFAAPSRTPIRRYFAFGSNMNPERVRSRGLVFEAIEGGVLDGYRLTFDKRAPGQGPGGHASVRWAPGAQVEGVLYLLEGPGEIEKMDVFERAPVNYSREVVRVRTCGGERLAWTYFANPAVLAPGSRPEPDYLAHLLRGRAYLSEAYFRRLAAWPCVEPGA